MVLPAVLLLCRTLSTTISTKHHIDIRPLDGIDWASAQYIEAAFSRVDSGGRVVGCNIYIPRISIMFCFGISAGPRPAFGHHFEHDSEYATVVRLEAVCVPFGNASSGMVCCPEVVLYRDVVRVGPRKSLPAHRAWPNPLGMTFVVDFNGGSSRFK